MALDCSSPAELAHHCREEQLEYRKNSISSTAQDGSTGSCLQLFICAALETDGNVGFTFICNLFRAQVETWIYRHPRFEETGEDAVWLVNIAFMNFYRQMRRPTFRERSTKLSGVLTLMKMCVHSAISEVLRKSAPPPDVTIVEMPDDLDIRDPGDNMEEHVNWKQILAFLETALPDPDDQLLAHLTFVDELKPQEIEEQYPGRWKGVRNRIYRIRQKLRNDENFLRLVFPYEKFD